MSSINVVNVERLMENSRRYSAYAKEIIGIALVARFDMIQRISCPRLIMDRI